jgi:hypothetical protein
MEQVPHVYWTRANFQTLYIMMTPGSHSSRSYPRDNSCVVRNVPKQYKVKGYHTLSAIPPGSVDSESDSCMGLYTAANPLGLMVSGNTERPTSLHVTAEVPEQFLFSARVGTRYEVATSIIR